MSAFKRVAGGVSAIGADGEWTSEGKPSRFFGVGLDGRRRYTLKRIVVCVRRRKP